jgi:hypothetical protein
MNYFFTFTINNKIHYYIKLYKYFIYIKNINNLMIFNIKVNNKLIKVF